jgi:hypothetical protein
MKVFKSIKIGVIILLFISCTKQLEIKQIEEESFEVYQLEPGYVGDIEKVGEYFFVADFSNKCIRKYDKNFKLLSKFGRRGKGPEEFLAPAYIRVYNQKLFILDRSLSAIKIFSIDGDFENCITLKKSNQPNYFCIIDSLIFVSGLDFVSRNIVDVYNLSGRRLLYSFAPKKEYNNYLENGVYNLAIVSEEDTTINLYYQKRKLVEQYTKEGNLICKKEIMVPFKINNISYADMRKFKNQVYLGTIIFQDVFFTGKETYAVVGGESLPPDKQIKELNTDLYLMKFSDVNEGYKYYKLNSENLHFNTSSLGIGITGDENYLYLLDHGGERVIKINTQMID